ncbi:hypothetical protein LC087_18450 [Bacillus carboniphilus]|uniref:SWIM-type domain-containing protein n=1 Tax=Bacillus carboniphilus TaxID=86663 RepID=A0ABY9JWH8_9BACI|nr:hypothetical protein [Bacillus carboniphilus]WLR42633.1 hypothetical protein LC087_18450 [Bacillus carboniphilus]
MKLDQFEEFIDDTILKRGRDYYEGDAVEGLVEAEPNQFAAIVYGSNVYDVDVKLGYNEEVLSSFCDCPYDWGGHCKHEVAVFFAIREYKKTVNTNPSPIKKEETKKSPPTIEEVVKGLSQSQLVHCVLTMAQDHPELEQQILFMYANKEDEIKEAKKLIRQSINQEKDRHGFVDWLRVSDALHGAYITSSKASEKIKERKFGEGVSLYLTILPPVIDMLQYCDDSGGSAGMMIEECLQKIHDALFEHGSTFTPEEREAIYEKVTKEALHHRYDDWSEWRMRLLEALVPLTTRYSIRTHFETLLEEQIDQIKEDSLLAKYDLVKIKMVQLKLLELHASKEKQEAFV